MLQNESITIAQVELLMQPEPHHKSHVFTIYSTTTFYSNYITVKAWMTTLQMTIFTKLTPTPNKMVAGIKLEHIKGLLLYFEST